MENNTNNNNQSHTHIQPNKHNNISHSNTEINIDKYRLMELEQKNFYLSIQELKRLNKENLSFWNKLLSFKKPVISDSILITRKPEEPTTSQIIFDSHNSNKNENIQNNKSNKDFISIQEFNEQNSINPVFNNQPFNESNLFFNKENTSFNQSKNPSVQFNTSKNNLSNSQIVYENNSSELVLMLMNKFKIERNVFSAEFTELNLVKNNLFLSPQNTFLNFFNEKLPVSTYFDLDFLIKKYKLLNPNKTETKIYMDSFNDYLNNCNTVINNFVRSYFKQLNLTSLAMDVFSGFIDINEFNTILSNSIKYKFILKQESHLNSNSNSNQPNIINFFLDFTNIEFSDLNNEKEKTQRKEKYSTCLKQLNNLTKYLKNNLIKVTKIKEYSNLNFYRASSGGVVFQIRALKKIAITSLSLMIFDEGEVCLDILCIQKTLTKDILVPIEKEFNEKGEDKINTKVKAKFKFKQLGTVFIGELKLEKDSCLTFVVSNFGNKQEHEVVREKVRSSDEFNINYEYKNINNDFILSETIDLSRKNKYKIEKDSSHYYYGDFIGNISYQVV